MHLSTFILITWLLVRLLNYLSNARSKQSQLGHDRAFSKYKNLNFYTNGQQRVETCHEYYAQVLDLYKLRHVTGRDVQLATLAKLNDARLLEDPEEREILITDIKAANAYLQVQWRYLSSVN